MKTTGKSRRFAAALISAAMLAGGASAIAGPAVAVSASDGPRVSQAAARAVVLGMLHHRGAISWQVLTRDAGAPGVARSVPKPGDSSQLEGVFCTAFVNCWAVGSYDSGEATLNQVLHWNGKKWTRVSVPNPAGTGMGDDNELFAVRCTKPSNCWAVGRRDKPNGPQLDQALHWNGKTWSKVSTPTPGGTLKVDFNELFEVTCTSVSNCWAAGDYGSELGLGHQVDLNQALHWNGKRWAQASTPNPAGTSDNDVQALDSVRCSSASNCWAVGAYGSLTMPEHAATLALHWNGKKWAKVTTPSPAGTAGGDINELIGVSCTAASNCWAVGDDGTITTTAITLVTLAEHWNGKKWATAAVPSPGGTGSGAISELSTVSCTNTTNCWAVGEYVHAISSTEQDTLNLAVRWTGKKWVKGTTPNPGGTADGDASELFGVRCTSTTRCWAVGFADSTGSEFNQALRWNGTKWASG
ncbi:MAG TPA: hypothetical protein VH641_09700 [Streptosporangiaceae bacterium]